MNFVKFFTHFLYFLEKCFLTQSVNADDTGFLNKGGGRNTVDIVEGDGVPHSVRGEAFDFAGHLFHSETDCQGIVGVVEKCTDQSPVRHMTAGDTGVLHFRDIAGESTQKFEVLNILKFFARIDNVHRVPFFDIHSRDNDFASCCIGKEGTAGHNIFRRAALILGKTHFAQDLCSFKSRNWLF